MIWSTGEKELGTFWSVSLPAMEVILYTPGQNFAKKCPMSQIPSLEHPQIMDLFSA